MPLFPAVVRQALAGPLLFLYGCAPRIDPPKDPASILLLDTSSPDVWRQIDRITIPTSSFQRGLIECKRYAANGRGVAITVVRVTPVAAPFAVRCRIFVRSVKTPQRNSGEILGRADARIGRELAAPSADAVRPALIAVVVTVDWEGTDIREENLVAMEKFLARHPKVRLTHFLNASYYTKPNADSDDVTEAMRRVIGRDDEVGLHLHGWRRLFEAAGVRFRGGPMFWGGALTLADCAADCGHEVPITVYSQAELQRVIRLSIDILVANGFGRPTSFRAGGWLASAAVRAAIANEGFVSDHSAVPWPFLAQELAGTPLLSMVRALWKNTTPTSQPYSISAGRHTIVEIPDNGALADYVTSEEMLRVFDEAILAFQNEGAHVEQVVSIGFHQETAVDYLPRLEEAVLGIEQRIASSKVDVRYVTSRDLKVIRSAGHTRRAPS